MRNIKIFDTTLRDGEQAPGCTMNVNEKLEMAKSLEKLGIDIIEAGFPVTSQGDFQAVSTIASEIKDSEVCALARGVERDIEVAFDAIKNAVAPRLHIFIPTSKLHITSKLKLDYEQILERIDRSVRHAKKLLNNVQMSFEDSTRSDPDYLVKAAKIAINAGATTINFADTVGYATPEEIAYLVEYIKSHVDMTNIEFGVHCHNDLGIAVANTLTAIRCGVNHVEGTINGIGERSGNAAIEEIVMALKVRKNGFDGADTRIDTKRIYPTSKLLSNIVGTQIPVNKPIVGANVFTHESGIHQHGLMNNSNTYEIISPESIGVPKRLMVLGKHSGKHAFEEYLSELDYNFTPAQIEKYFNDFKSLCDKKKNVTGLDIEALVAGKEINPNGYTLKNFLIATKKDGAFATVTLKSGDTEKAYQAEGNGAIDSSFRAVNKILGQELKLIDFSIHAITGGEDALGEAVVKLSDGNNMVTGRGLSTDIIEASIFAYIDAANKLMEA